MTYSAFGKPGQSLPMKNFNPTATPLNHIYNEDGHPVIDVTCNECPVETLALMQNLATVLNGRRSIQDLDFKGKIFYEDTAQGFDLYFKGEDGTSVRGVSAIVKDDELADRLKGDKLAAVMFQFCGAVVDHGPEGPKKKPFQPSAQRM